MTEERRKGERRQTAAIDPAKRFAPREISARIFAHPRCTAGPALGAMAAGLEAHGFDFTSIKLFAGFGQRAELVREIGTAGTVTEYERMNGERFKHRMGQSAPEPEYA